MLKIFAKSYVTSEGNKKCVDFEKNSSGFPILMQLLLIWTRFEFSDSVILHETQVGNRKWWDNTVGLKPCPLGSSVVYMGSCVNCLIGGGVEQVFIGSNTTTRVLMCSEDPYYGEQMKVQEGHKFLRERTLKMVTVIRPPFVEMLNGEYDGVVIEVLNALQKKHNFSRVIRLQEDNKWGSILGNGSWVGMVGQVFNHEVDMGITGFSVIHERSKVIDFTMAFHQEPAAILIPAPRAGNKLTILIRPFHFEVWLTVFATVFVLGPSLYVLHMASLWIRGELDASRETVNGPVLICDLFQFIIGSLVQEGLKSPVQKTTKFVVILWWFFTLVLANIYTGYMVSFLSAPKLHDLVQDLDDLVNNQRELKWTYRETTALGTLFSKSQSGTYRKVYEKMDPKDLAKNDMDGVSKVLTGKYAFLKEKSFLDVVLSDDLNKTRMCRMTRAKETFFTVGFAFILQKGSAFLELINADIGNSLTTGLMQKWKEMHWPKHLECENAASFILKTQPKTRKLTVDDCQGANFLLICGLSAASISFLMESLTFFRNKLRKCLWERGFLIQTSCHAARHHRVKSERKTIMGDNLDIYKIIVIPVKEEIYEKMNRREEVKEEKQNQP